MRKVEIELKGIVKLGKIVALTNCHSVTDILIGGVSLHQKMIDLFPYIGKDYFEDGWDNPIKPPNNDFKISVVGDSDLEDIEAKRLFISYIGDCGYDCICGYGGFDYIIEDENETSIFTEFLKYIGKEVVFVVYEE